MNYFTFINTKTIGFWSGIILFILILSLPDTVLLGKANPIIAVASWMIIWWITEVVSISVTALLPLVLIPLLDISDIKTVAANYAHPIVFLFFGGFVIALALQKVNLHRRIALTILKITGTSANGVILGFMLSTALMSMWISNTASTVVMLPIASSVIDLLIKEGESTRGHRNFALAIMLGIAFSANIGGIATLVGTPPNSVMLGFVQNEYDIDIGFLDWMVMGVPFSCIMLGVAYFFIVKVFYPNRLGQLSTSASVIDNELKKLGKPSKNEKTVLVIFCIAVLLWVMRTQINNWLPFLKLNDTIISLSAAVAMFIIPTNLRKPSFALEWKDTKELPWGILILFGGGLSLASGLASSGLVDLVGEFISSRENWSVFVITSVLILLMLFMTELMSNVALVAVLMPLVGGIAVGLGVPILTLVIPVAMASSCAFMLPMATPPNAIVFSSGHIRVHQMARIGVVLNVISVVLLISITYSIISFLFG